MSAPSDRRKALAREALASTRSNIVPLIHPERSVQRRHLVPDTPIRFIGTGQVRKMTARQFQEDVVRPYLIAEKACEMRVLEQSRAIAADQSGDIDWIEAFRSIQGAARTLRLMADVAESGTARMEAAMIDAGVLDDR